MDDSDTAYVMVYQERVLVRVLGRIVTRDDGIQGNMCDKDKFGYIWLYLEVRFSDFRLTQSFP